MGKAQLKFSLSLVAVIALIAVVVGLVAGRAAGGTSSTGGGGGSGGAAAGKKVDVIIKASNSSFWQTMLAGSSKASKDFGIDVGLFGPAQEIDIPEQVQLVGAARERQHAALARDVLDAALDGGEEGVGDVLDDDADARRQAVGAAQRARRDVVAVAERGDRLVDALCEVAADGGVGVDDPRDGAEAHAGKRRDLLHRGAATTPPTG